MRRRRNPALLPPFEKAYSKVDTVAGREAAEDAQRNRASRRENEELTVFIVAISDTLCRSHQNDNAVVSPFLQKIQANQLVPWIFFILIL